MRQFNSTGGVTDNHGAAAPTTTSAPTTAATTPPTTTAAATTQPPTTTAPDQVTALPVDWYTPTTYRITPTDAHGNAGPATLRACPPIPGASDSC